METTGLESHNFRYAWSLCSLMQVETAILLVSEPKDLVRPKYNDLFYFIRYLLSLLVPAPPLFQPPSHFEHHAVVIVLHLNFGECG